jgi:ferredoxin-NADP reductase/MOSC domain-containing protein YiiM
MTPDPVKDLPMQARLISVNVGKPKDVAWQGRTVHTGIFKYPVTGPVMARTLDLDGDGQGDLNGHGGEMRAVLVYQRDSYDYWRRYLDRDDLEYGQFGENFTVEGLSDDEVHIGDRYRIGDAEFEVSQPRVTCFRDGLRMGEPRMPALLVSQRRPGFYLRVITEGRVRAGDEIVRTRVGRHRMSVAAIDALLYLPDRDIDALRAATDLPALSPGWQQSFRDLLAAAESGTPATTPAVGVEPGWTGFRRLRVARMEVESSTVASIYLEATDGSAVPPYQPGQFLTLRMPGAGTPAPVRSYSLSSAATGDHYRISVKRDARGLVSSYVHTHLEAGSLIEAAAPRGDFTLDENRTGPVVLLSAGIGVTPVLAMLQRLSTSGSGREIWWVHTARSPAEQAFGAEAHTLLQRLARSHEHVVYTGPRTDPVTTGATATFGRLDAKTLGALALPVDAEVYLCGPAPFMAAMRQDLVGLGLDPARMHSELFGTLPAINPGITDERQVAPHPPAGPAGRGPQITFARSGLTVPWSEQYGALLELAENCDVPTRWSCRAGVCHTCVTPLLTGAVAYDPAPLEPPESGAVLVCCSRPCTDLVLDL